MRLLGDTDAVIASQRLLLLRGCASSCSALDRPGRFSTSAWPAATFGVKAGRLSLPLDVSCRVGCFYHTRLLAYALMTNYEFATAFQSSQLLQAML
jgi:hypothetical protein